ncbi:MAG: MarR family transcriptional regulator [Alphaproteobacteria bacterium HGW-Alphaproteobacteria-16]|nr:MAG: MarR family transcriptional regulator [Alphaproteobacteria bacterium HGW-Alphaproteobacteria-16]
MAEKAEYTRRIRSYLASRQARHTILNGEWFGDPAWDMLLDLLASSYESRNVSIGSACIAAAVPQTTALRWVNRLVAAGALLRHSDPRDGRRNYLMLDPALAARLELWVSCYLMPPNLAPGRSSLG